VIICITKNATLFGVDSGIQNASGKPRMEVRDLPDWATQEPLSAASNTSNKGQP
jgi:hypothetical protein